MQSITEKSEFETYVPKPIPKAIGFAENDVLAAWHRVIRNFGGRGLYGPIVTHDPEIPVQFGISLDWRILINTASLPMNVPKNKLLWWIEAVALRHEFGHYHICPYSGRDILRYLQIITDQYRGCDRKKGFYILNLFSDLIVNRFLYQRYKDDFVLGMQYWFEWQDLQCKANQIGHSYTWNIFVRIHEILWGVSKFATTISPEEDDAATKIATKLQSFTDENVFLISFVKIMRKFIDDDLATNQQVADLGQLKIGYNYAYTILPDQNDDPQNNDSNGDGDDSQTDDKSTDPETNGSDDTVDTDTSGDQDGDTPNSNSKLKKSVIYNGEIVPFDVLQTGGDPFDEKYNFKVTDVSRDAEIEDAIDNLIKSMAGMRGSRCLNQMILDYGLANSDNDAYRMILRSQAKDLFKYEIVGKKPFTRKKDKLAQWNWNDSMQHMNIRKSLSISPLYPFPPNARKWADTHGSTGKLSKQYKDILIVQDSSGSMIGLRKFENMNARTPFDFAVLASFAVLHAAAAKNVQISVINFSSNAMVMPWKIPSKQNIISAELLLMHFFSCGTEVPVTKIEQLISQKDDALVVIISDAEMGNMDASIQMLKKLATKYTFFIFQIGSRENTLFSARGRACGAFIQYIEKIEDLPTIVLKNVKAMYM